MKRKLPGWIYTKSIKTNYELKKMYTLHYYKNRVDQNSFGIFKWRDRTGSLKIKNFQTFNKNLSLS